MRNYAEIGCLTLLGVTLTVYIAKCNNPTERNASVPESVPVELQVISDAIGTEDDDSLSSGDRLFLFSWARHSAVLPFVSLAGLNNMVSANSLSYLVISHSSLLSLQREQISPVHAINHLLSGMAAIPLDASQQLIHLVSGLFIGVDHNLFSSYIPSSHNIRAGPSSTL